MKRIVLGTAQLSGFLYGGLTAPLTRTESFAILDAAWDAGIRAFDTAESYGTAAERLEAWLETRGYWWKVNGVSTKVTLGHGIWDRAAGATMRFSQCRAENRLLVYAHGWVGGREWERFRDGVWSCAGQAGQSIYHNAAPILELPGLARLQVPLALLAQEPQCHSETQPIPLDVRSVLGVGVTNPVARIQTALRWLRPQDRLVIGVDNPEQINAIVEAVKP